jgi:nucleoside-diphosphate-sugar epimerase
MSDLTGATGMRTHTDERFLVTGALGCIGAWTLRDLAREGTPVVAFDQATDPRRVRQICTDEELARITFASGDITDLGSVERALDEHGITNIIHLAALQVPFCRADPALGARVNVLGTVHVFEAARRRQDRIRQVVYTGSIGMFDAADADPGTNRLENDATAHPINHYGVYKQANEGTARVYWLENGVSSVGLRPMTVYGTGRDQGMTSSPTKAIVAALLGRPATVSFSGRTLLQYADDVARTLLVASRSPLRGAHAFNLGGNLVDMRDFVAEIDAQLPGAGALITVEGAALPFPEQISDAALAMLGPVPVTSIRDGIAETIALLVRQRDAGALVPERHGL